MAEDSVILGFLKKPKNPRSLLRHLFPSKAGGVPVCCLNPSTFIYFLNLLVSCKL